MFKKRNKKNNKDAQPVEPTQPTQPIDYTRYTFEELNYAEMLDDENDVDMCLRYGKGYYNDQQNYEKALKWYYKAALQNNDEAQYQVGNIYRCGLGVSQDYKQGMYWCIKAAENGNTDGMNGVGWMYLKGQGVTKNILTAIEWYTKAANQGHSKAQSNLGYVYQTEDEVKDLQKAVNWFQKAADNDHHDSKNYVKELNNNGYFAKKDAQIETEEKEKGIDNTSNNNVTIRNPGNTQGETSTSAVHHDQMNSGIDHDQRSNLINRDYFYKEITIPKQDQALKGEGAKQLGEQLKKLEAKLDDNRGNDLNYDSSDNESNGENDINYDSECSNDEDHNNRTNI